MSHSTIKDKIILITGASSGLGKATAMELAKKGAKIIMVNRNPERGKSAQAEIIKESKNNSINLFLTDLSSQDGIRQLVKDIKNKYQKIDILINNAGGVYYQREETVDGIERTIALNLFAPFLLTNLLLETLKKSDSAKIINVTTKPWGQTEINLHDIEFKTRKYNGTSVYTQSKVGVTLFTYKLAQKLKNTHITVNCVHPGIFKSNFGKYYTHEPFLFQILGVFFRAFMSKPEDAAQRVLYLVDSPNADKISGKYFENKQEMQSLPQTYDKVAQDELWKICEKMTGLP